MIHFKCTYITALYLWILQSQVMYHDVIFIVDCCVHMQYVHKRIIICVLHIIYYINLCNITILPTLKLCDKMLVILLSFVIHYFNFEYIYLTVEKYQHTLISILQSQIVTLNIFKSLSFIFLTYFYFCYLSVIHALKNVYR